MSSIHVTNVKDASGNAALVTESGGVKTDKLTGITTAGSISVVGEGNSTTTNLQQGLCKAWAETNAAGSSIAGSFNIASLVDTNTGIQTCNYTNDFANANYPVVTTGKDVGDDLTFSASATGTWIVYAFNGSAYADVGQCTIASGDLA